MKAYLSIKCMNVTMIRWSPCDWVILTCTGSFDVVLPTLIIPRVSTTPLFCNLTDDIYSQSIYKSRLSCLIPIANLCHSLSNKTSVGLKIEDYVRQTLDDQNGLKNIFIGRKVSTDTSTFLLLQATYHTYQRKQFSTFKHAWKKRQEVHNAL